MGAVRHVDQGVTVLEFPPLEIPYCCVKRVALFAVLGGREKLLVGRYRQIQRSVIMLSAGERSGVVGDVGACQIVARKSSRNLLPPYHALTRIRFRQRPKVPSGAVLGIGGNRPGRELTHGLRSAASEPIRVSQSDQRRCIVGSFGDRSL